LTHLGKSHETREIELTRETFERVNKELFERCLNLVKTVADQAKKAGSPVGAILATGGSSQIPYLRDKLKSGMGIVPAVSAFIEFRKAGDLFDHLGSFEVQR
jgi:molecular chaperone DnaK (HSP70)